MFAVTHAFLSMAAAAGATGVHDSIGLGIAAVASQLPDIDTSKSLAGRTLFPIAHLLEKHFPHRSATHSFVASVIVAIASLPMGLYGGHWQWWGCLTIGYFAGWFADAFTRAGVEALWPDTVRVVIPGNPRARLVSGSKAEYWWLATAVVITVGLVNLNSAGGLTEAIGQRLVQQTSTTIEMLGTAGSDQVVWVEVTGSHRQTGERLEKAQFQALEPMGSGILVMDDEGAIFAIGPSTSAQIYPQRVRSFLGEPLVQTYQSTLPREVGADEWMVQLPRDAYLSGYLELDDIEDLQISRDLEEYPRMKVEGSRLVLTWCRPSDLWTAIRDFWILTGEVVMRERKIAS